MSFYVYFLPDSFSYCIFIFNTAIAQSFDLDYVFNK